MTTRMTGARLLQTFAQGPILVAPEYVPALRALAEESGQGGAIAQIAQSLGFGGKSAREEANTVTNDYLCMSMGLGPSDRSKPFAFSQGVAVIPMYGALLHRDNWCDSYATGYDFIRSRFHAAQQDSDVQGIVFDINTGGGHVAGNFELADEMYALRGKKPTLGIIDNACYSGGYSLGSCLDKLVATPSGGAGSIGVVMMHASVQELMSKWGIKISYVYAGDHKVDGNPFSDLPDDVRAAFQARVDTSYDKFVSLVARNRGIDADKVIATQARCYNAEDALKLGLIDAIQTPSVALAAFFASLNGSTTEPKKGATSMSDTNKAGGEADTPNAEDTNKPNAQATGDISAADAVAQDRERCNAILNCEEAKGREELAKHLAFKTSMSADDAKAMLATAPKAEAANPNTATNADAFKNAMANTTNPDVGAGGGNGEETAEEPVHVRMAKAHALATGTKYEAAK